MVVVAVVEVVVVVLVVVVVGFGVVLGRGVALGGAEVEGVPRKEIKWASWIILLISNTFFLALVKKKLWMNWSNKVFSLEYDVQSHWSCTFDSWKCNKNVWDFLESINTSGK